MIPSAPGQSFMFQSLYLISINLLLIHEFLKLDFDKAKLVAYEKLIHLLRLFKRKYDVTK